MYVFIYNWSSRRWVYPRLKNFDGLGDVLLTSREIDTFPLWRDLRMCRTPDECLNMSLRLSRLDSDDRELLSLWLARYRPNWPTLTNMYARLFFVFSSEEVVTLAVMMGSHARLGAGSPLSLLEREVMQLICDLVWT